MVFVCSPFAGCVRENIQNARRYSRFTYLSGYMPITPHLMYPRYLDDTQTKERQDGMDMGIRLLDLCEEIWVFGDIYSSGMQREMTHALGTHMTIRFFDRDCKEYKNRVELALQKEERV
ncbi:MAG: DUF4406 domain-containing protein [Clostridiaceae bacterium]